MSILEDTGVGRAKGDTMSSLTKPATAGTRVLLSLGGSFGGDGSLKECFVAAVSTEYLVADESSVPYADNKLHMESTGDTSPLSCGGGAPRTGGLVVTWSPLGAPPLIAPPPTGFLLGMMVGGLFILDKDDFSGNEGKGELIPLVAILLAEGDGTGTRVGDCKGDAVMVAKVLVSLGGSAGRDDDDNDDDDGSESFRTGRTTCGGMSLGTPGGGSGRAFEKRERPPVLGTTREMVSILFDALCHGPESSPSFLYCVKKKREQPELETSVAACRVVLWAAPLSPAECPGWMDGRLCAQYHITQGGKSIASGLGMMLRGLSQGGRNTESALQKGEVRGK